MEKAKIETHEIEAGVFPGYVFRSEASLLSSVAVLPVYFGVNEEFFQPLRTAIEVQNKLGSFWFSLLGPASVGQFTLKNNCSAFVFAREDGIIRPATPDEAQCDFDNFGEQVMGDEVKIDPPQRYCDQHT